MVMEAGFILTLPGIIENGGGSEMLYHYNIAI
jgi:hypothetical protein